jgi:hypothetical protein
LGLAAGVRQRRRKAAGWQHDAETVQKASIHRPIEAHSFSTPNQTRKVAAKFRGIFERIKKPREGVPGLRISKSADEL